MELVENGIARRSRMDLWTDAEKKIQLAVDEVERLGANPKLTDAVRLLQEAKGVVADWYEGDDGVKYRMSNAKPV